MSEERPHYRILTAEERTDLRAGCNPQATHFNGSANVDADVVLGTLAYVEDLERELQQARQELAARAWVCCADRLPEFHTDVLVWPKTRKEGVAPYTKVYVAEYHRAFSADQQPAYWQGEQEWWDVWEITHWQPLPPTPRG